MVSWSRDFVCLFPSLVKFKFLVIFSRCKCTCCSSDAVTKANKRLRNASAVTSEITLLRGQSRVKLNKKLKILRGSLTTNLDTAGQPFT